MPHEILAQTHVNNGADDQHINVLRVQWGKPGAFPDAASGWVNQGYVMVHIEQMPDDTGKAVTHYVTLDEAYLNNTIRVLQKVRRQVFHPKK